METTKLRSTILLGTLKPSGEFSHTEVLCRLLIDRLKEQNVSSEVVRLVDYNIKPGLKTEMNDDWAGILKKVLESDIVIFATPIWWGLHSSLIQKVIERMDELNDKLLETGESDFANKVGGIVITGAEDGAEHIIGNLCNFMVWNGFTMPPACSLSWLGDASKDNAETLKKKFEETKSTKYMAQTMATNLTFMARLLKQNPYPKNLDGGIIKDIAPGTVGMKA
jgi:multimeric flavodoxin WrbA